MWSETRLEDEPRELEDHVVVQPGDTPDKAHDESNIQGGYPDLFNDCEGWALPQKWNGERSDAQEQHEQYADA